VPHALTPATLNSARSGILCPGIAPVFIRLSHNGDETLRTKPPRGLIARQTAFSFRWVIDRIIFRDTSLAKRNPPCESSEASRAGVVGQLVVLYRTVKI
jgi:hypothetical protein